MWGTGTLRQISATGDITTAEATIGSLGLSGTADCSAVIRVGGSGGTVVATLRALANSSAFRQYNGALMPALHVTLTGAGAVLDVELA